MHGRSNIDYNILYVSNVEILGIISLSCQRVTQTEIAGMTQHNVLACLQCYQNNTQ